MTLKVFCLALAAYAALAQYAVADESPDIIRDAEIENNIRTWATPIFTAAGLDPQAVHIYIINDPTLNSFVAGGQNLFMNTGTLLRADRPNEIIGIMAHETGHIAGGHLVRFEEEMHDATIKGIIAMVAGVAAGAVGHNPGAMGAGMAAGEEVGLRSYLSFSVAQEASADQAALKFLDATHQSAQGLLDFFEILEQEEFLSAQRQDPYLRTHPLTSAAHRLCARACRPIAVVESTRSAAMGGQFQHHEGQARRFPQPAQRHAGPIQGR